MTFFPVCCTTILNPLVRWTAENACGTHLSNTLHSQKKRHTWQKGFHTSAQLTEQAQQHAEYCWRLDRVICCIYWNLFKAKVWTTFVEGHLQTCVQKYKVAYTFLVTVLYSPSSAVGLAPTRHKLHKWVAPTVSDSHRTDHKKASVAPCVRRTKWLYSQP